MTSLLQDLRYGFRLLRKSPGFTLVCILVLAIAIGANSAIFSLVDAALLRPLPYRNSDELVRLWERPPGYEHNSVAPLNYADWSEQNRSFTVTAAIAGSSKTLTNAGTGAERITGQSVTHAFFDLFGVQPIAGRTFAAADATSRTNVVVLSEKLWRNRFGADPRLVGRAISLDGELATVIGVVPASFQALYESEIWSLFVPQRGPEQRRMHYLQVFGRLKPGISIEQARADMALVAANVARVSPETNKNWGVTIEPLRQAMVGREFRTTSLVLAGMVGFLLLMACANIANLLMARATGRTREIAVRASLGGSRGRIARQLLTESAVLSMLGGALGAGLAWALIRSAPSFLPAGTVPVGITPVLDARIVGFTFLITAGTAILFGFAPAWQATRTALADYLRSGGRTATGPARVFHATLAGGQIAVALVLASGAGLLIRTLDSLNRVDPGFHADKVLTMSVSLPFKQYSPARTLEFWQSAEREIAATPGVRSVGLATNLPLTGWDIGQGFQIVGDPPLDTAAQPAAHYQMVSTGYFKTMGIALLRGRSFTIQDTKTTVPVCVVNQEFVKRYLKGRDPIGMKISLQSMSMEGPTPVVREIIGEIRQVKVAGPGEKEASAEVYVPLAQNAWYGSAIAVRTDGDPLAMTSAVKQAIARVNKDIPATRILTMDEVTAESTSQPRFRARVVTSFALVAIILAVVGVSGVLAFAVSRRTREFGIRMALGASGGRVLGLVLGQGSAIVAGGLVSGALGAAALTRSLSTLLFGVQPLDPLTFVVTPAILACAALMACAVPAWRASRVDPVVALRDE